MHIVFFSVPVLIHLLIQPFIKQLSWARYYVDARNHAGHTKGDNPLSLVLVMPMTEKEVPERVYKKISEIKFVRWYEVLREKIQPGHRHGERVRVGLGRRSRPWQFTLRNNKQNLKWGSEPFRYLGKEHTKKGEQEMQTADNYLAIFLNTFYF